MSAASKVRATYGSRDRARTADAGIRPVAPTFGKTRITGYSAKTEYGDMEVESPAELLVADLLSLDPTVRQFEGQPLTVDLIDRRILRTKVAVAEARARHKSIKGPKFYTPDFGCDYIGDSPAAVEVKLEGYGGSVEYAQKLAQGKALLEASGYQFLFVVIPSNPWHPLRVNLGGLALAAVRKDLWPDASQAHAIQEACGPQGCSLGGLCNALGLSPDLAPAWLVSGVLAADLARQPINFDLHVTPAHGDLSHLAMLKEFAL